MGLLSPGMSSTHSAGKPGDAMRWTVFNLAKPEMISKAATTAQANTSHRLAQTAGLL